MTKHTSEAASPEYRNPSLSTSLPSNISTTIVAAYTYFQIQKMPRTSPSSDTSSPLASAAAPISPIPATPESASSSP